MADTPIETPLETARRVWPGAWEELRPPDTCVLRAGLWIARISVTFYRVGDGDWIVEGPFQDIARGPDLPAVLAEARDKVQAAVADLARAVGLEVNNG